MSVRLKDDGTLDFGDSYIGPTRKDSPYQESGLMEQIRQANKYSRLSEEKLNSFLDSLILKQNQEVQKEPKNNIWEALKGVVEE